MNKYSLNIIVKNTSLVIIRVFSSTCDRFIIYGEEGVQSYYDPFEEESWEERDSS